MALGMFLLRMPRPRPLAPAFRVRIPVTLSASPSHRKETIELVAYVPTGYCSSYFAEATGAERAQHDTDGGHRPDVDDSGSKNHDHVVEDEKGRRHREKDVYDGATAATKDQNEAHRYPAVLNFHGGGFALGSAADDARWATAVVEQVDAVVISVEYRLAPERPFPAAVEDGVDALLWLYKHADALSIDRQRIALSGFSAGGNLCFTVPLRLREELRRRAASALASKTAVRSRQRTNLSLEEATGDVREPPLAGYREDDSQQGPDNDIKKAAYEDLTIRALLSWYPPVDYTLSREVRRASNPGGPSKSLNPVMATFLEAACGAPPSPWWPFGSAAAQQPWSSHRKSPYLSPALASDEDLLDALPEHVILYTCQWDFLFREGEDFRERLLKMSGRDVGGTGGTGGTSLTTLFADPEHTRKRRTTTTTTVELEKKSDKKHWDREASARSTKGKGQGETRGNTIDVRGGIIPQAVHAWDKNSPLEYFFDPGKKKMTSVTAFYEEACRELQRALAVSGAGD